MAAGGDDEGHEVVLLLVQGIGRHEPAAESLAPREPFGGVVPEESYGAFGGLYGHERDGDVAHFGN